MYIKGDWLYRYLGIPVQSEIQKERIEKFNVIDPTAIGPNIRLIVLTLRAPVQQDGTGELSGTYEVELAWAEVEFGSVYKEEYPSSTEAVEKFEQLNSELKELKSLAQSKDPRAQELSQQFFDKLGLSKKNADPQPVAAMQYHGFPVEIVRAARYGTIVKLMGFLICVPTDSLIKIQAAPEQGEVSFDALQDDDLSFVSIFVDDAIDSMREDYRPQQVASQLQAVFPKPIKSGGREKKISYETALKAVQDAQEIINERMVAEKSGV